MTGKQAGFIGKGQYLSTDAVDKRMIISPWQICSPNAALENYITAK
jgi:hypothetical protein